MMVTYERSGCKDIRFFKNKEELNEWLERQLIVQPRLFPFAKITFHIMRKK